MSVPRFRRVNFGAYDNYVPVEDVSKKSWNQQHFSLMFSKPNRPGKKWRSTPSELRENSAMGDVVKDEQKATPMWMTRSLLKISEKPSAYLAARRRPPFFTGPQKTSESTELSPGEKNQMYKKERNQAEKTTKKKVAGLPRGSKTKQPDTADISSRESDSESKGSGESKPKEGKDSHEDKEPDAETKDSDVSEKDTEKKRKPKESDAESTDSKNEKKSDKDSRKKPGDLDKTFKRKTKSSDFEFKDILKKDKDIKKKTKDLVIEATGLKKSDKDLRKKCKDFSIDYKNEKREKALKKKSKDSVVEFKDTKKKDESSKKRSKDLNNKSQNLKTEDKKPNEGDVESEYSYDSKMKSQKANIPKDSKKSKDGKITFKGSDTEPTKRESELDLETPKISRGAASIKSPMAPQALPQLVKSEIRKAPLPEAQWIQKLI
ncbi:cylicin-1 [Antechinus flavipes]|uniref:cylicin-1 n=1 Tax=Antechinus flavipes TaxID=38775 RepID=UPI002236409D|nr:cylicin-1 [Antechinus flavipes]